MDSIDIKKYIVNAMNTISILIAIRFFGSFKRKNAEIKPKKRPRPIATAANELP